MAERQIAPISVDIGAIWQFQVPRFTDKLLYMRGSVFEPRPPGYYRL